jgi:UDP-glucuronate 4-epimerase
MKKILVTGSAGFIGSALSLRLLSANIHVVGIDNHNNYYDPKLKEARLERHLNHQHYKHHKVSIEDHKAINTIFENNEFDAVVNLAAQAGVRYSLENPRAYINTNIMGFMNILECCREYKIKHLIYASSSSVYGANKEIPFSVNQNVDHPISIYATTKKTNELMAHTYSHLYKLPTTGLRFFTVYGPWDRPDMALQVFAQSIVSNSEVKLYNYGKHKRDFTYIDDIVEGIIRILDKPASPNKNFDPYAPDPGSSHAPWKIYNIGNNNMEELNKYIDILEKELGIKAKRKLVPIQPGDIENTYADITNLIRDFDYQPKTSIEEGISKFAKWYKDYYSK